MSESSSLVRITILIRKQDHISYEDFHNWSTSHPKIWLSVPIVREKIVKYSQFHVNDALRAQLGAKLPFAQYDGAAEMCAKSFDDLMEVFSNEEYLRVVVPDEQTFLKRDEAVMMLGWEVPRWFEGEEI
ncbi:hypothetical protein H2200_001864 [Cladophialophora chaetospira]|uniref:EthD domain-containing protein n=1 Tax=Cladophialophora chaetospira TaxID=386627 RepID=A0AA39CQ27_9EURO|nr:hypothetical protein H2200_001864 [Cladophialophora chaetospira]